MAHRFFKIFLWYGLVTQFYQTSCFRNSWSRTSSPEETTFRQKFFFQSRNLQRNKKFLIHKHFDESSFKRMLKIPHANTSLTLAVDEINNKKISNEKLQQKEFQMKETKHRRDLLTAQVPDDDIEDNGSTIPDEIPLKVLVEPPKSFRYFYRDNKKLLVKNDWEEGSNYYSKVNKNAGDDSGSGSSEQDSDISQQMENLLYKEDALEKLNYEGPIFKDTMTWVNTMREDRGWFPKVTHN